MRDARRVAGRAFAPQSIIYTSSSGTFEGRALVLPAHVHQPRAHSWWFITGEDQFLVNMPMFHIGGLGLSFSMLVRRIDRAAGALRPIASGRWCARRV
jgi:hypothetical protein